MTMLTIDESLVIFEGIHRIRWATQPNWLGTPNLAPRAGTPTGELGRPASILGDVWPDNTTRTRLRRQIDHRQKVVVMLEHGAPTIQVPRNRVPRIPDGIIELEGSTPETCLLSIPPLTWLAAPDRCRGEEFICRSHRIVTGLTGSPPDLLVEETLLGSPEPLRFVYQTAPMTIDQMRATIDRLYRVGATGKLPAVLPAAEPDGAGQHLVDQPRAA